MVLVRLLLLLALIGCVVLMFVALALGDLAIAALFLLSGVGLLAIDAALMRE